MTLLVHRPNVAAYCRTPGVRLSEARVHVSHLVSSTSIKHAQSRPCLALYRYLLRRLLQPRQRLLPSSRTPIRDLASFARQVGGSWAVPSVRSHRPVLALSLCLYERPILLVFSREVVLAIVRTTLEFGFLAPIARFDLEFRVRCLSLLLQGM